MARKPTSNAWQWSRSAETRRVLLEAARAVFAVHGYDGASIADVVERAGSSVGSLYHHFGGKAELFVALWQDHQDAQEQRVVGAVAEARASGEEDLLTLFIQGARAYFDGTWEQRDVARLFMTGDGPPGFEMMRRTRGHESDPAERRPARGRHRPGGPDDGRGADHHHRRDGPGDRGQFLPPGGERAGRRGRHPHPRLDPLRPVSPGPQ